MELQLKPSPYPLLQNPLCRIFHSQRDSQGGGVSEPAYEDHFAVLGPFNLAFVALVWGMFYKFDSLAVDKDIAIVSLVLLAWWYICTVIVKIFSGVLDKMAGRHSVLYLTFWFLAGHFATGCPANRKLSARYFMYFFLTNISSTLTTIRKCLISVPDISKLCRTCPTYLAITDIWI